MKRILIALDYNSSAEKVAETGYEIASALKAEIYIIHVITEPAYYAVEYTPFIGSRGSSFRKSTNAIVENIKNEAEFFLASSVDHLADKNIKTMVLEGDTTDAILKFSKDCEADLIVMGSHNHKGLEGLFVTDIASSILKHTHIPLLAIPTNT